LIHISNRGLFDSSTWVAINYDIRPLAASYVQRFAADLLLAATTDARPSAHAG
jgi:hypothetical protein